MYHWLDRGTGGGNGTLDGAGGLRTSPAADAGDGRPALFEYSQATELYTSDGGGNCRILKSCLDKVAFNVCLYLDLQIQAEK